MLTLGQNLLKNEKHYPHRDAVVFNEERISFSQLADKARRLGSALHRLGLRHQDRFSMLAMNCIEYVIAWSAAELSGLVLGTVNFRLAPPEIEFILNDSSPEALIFESQYSGMVAGLRERLKTVRHYICIGSDAPEWALRFDDLIASGAPEGAPYEGRANDILAIIYTSGTTGRPKGVIRSNRADARNVEIFAGEMGVTVDDKYLIIMPVFHVGGRSQYSVAHWRGATTVLQRIFDPPAIARAIAREKATMLHVAPTMFQAIMDHPEVDPNDLKSLRIIQYAAAPMPVPLLRRGLDLLGPVFVNGYGATEVSGAVLPRSMHEPDAASPLHKRLASVGQPVTGCKIRIVDNDEADCPTGVVGELLIQSETLMDGYWNNHAASIEAMRGGWYRTGDMAYVDEENYIYLVDRKKDMIISGGENIYCREVEEALLSHRAVADVAVIGVPDDYWGESVKAVVVVKSGETTDGRDLIEHTRARIARYKCPKSIVFVADLPRLPSGKINKVILRETFRV